jgi:hypothetical protein
MTSFLGVVVVAFVLLGVLAILKEWTQSRATDAKAARGSVWVGLLLGCGVVTALLWAARHLFELW